MLLLFNSTIASFSLFYILDTRSSFFLVLTLFFLWHLSFYIPYTALLLFLLSLLLSLSNSMLPSKDHTTHFSLIFWGESSALDFYRSVLFCSHILYNPHRSLPPPLWSILYQVKGAPSRGIFHSSQYSCTFSYVGHAGLVSCYAFCGLAICTASSSLCLSFSATVIEHSHLKCPTSQHLKYCSFSFSCLLTFTFSLILHLTTLLANISNLLWGIGFLFFTSFWFLQL